MDLTTFSLGFAAKSLRCEGQAVNVSVFNNPNIGGSRC